MNISGQVYGIAESWPLIPCGPLDGVNVYSCGAPIDVRREAFAGRTIRALGLTMAELHAAARFLVVQSDRHIHVFTWRRGTRTDRGMQDRWNRIAENIRTTFKRNIERTTPYAPDATWTIDLHVFDSADAYYAAESTLNLDLRFESDTPRKLGADSFLGAIVTTGKAPRGSAGDLYDDGEE